MKYKVRRNPGMKGFKNILKIKMKKEKKKVVGYKVIADLNTGDFSRSVNISSDFERTIVMVSYYDKQRKIDYQKETVYERGKKESEIITKNEEENNKLFINKYDGDRYLSYVREYHRDISFLVKKDAVIYTIKKDFLHLKDGEVVENKNINIPHMQRIKRLN